MNTTRTAPARRIFALTTASGLALSAMIATPAMAQDAEVDEEVVAEDEGNAIIVTGFKASLENAQNVKRDADTFVDAVTAEDIGALPDRSVAETLQRIPGVNIGRFEKTSDPDRFSVEGTGVIVRGLPFVRSELNGRDIFSATGGRVLSFNDVSPELLGRVEVFKNVTPDMVDGGIAGTVNLVTRKPLDSPGFRLSGAIEANVGDLAEEWSPGFSLLGSGTIDLADGDAGTLGLQLSYAQSELVSRTDASQVTDPCYRAATFDQPCIRALQVVDGGFTDQQNFDASNFPPSGALVVPKGAGVRTTDLERDRNAWSAVMQYEDPTGDLLLTFEWLRAETEFFTDEAALLAQVNDEGLFPVPAAGSTWEFDSNGVFQRGILSQRIGDAYANPFGRGGIPMEALRFQRQTEATTQDFSFDAQWNVTDRFRINFEAQSIESDLRRDSIIGVTNSWANIDLDLSGKTPQVSFLAPPGAEADYFASGLNTYYWFLLDSLEQNDGNLESLRFDAEYDISDDGFFKAVRVGGRWAERERVTRNTDFSTWGNLSAPWAGRAGCAPWNAGPNCPFVPGRYFTGLPGQEFAIAGGVFTDEYPEASQLRNPFGNNFQRGNAPSPLPGGTFFFGGDDFIGEYLAGTSKQQAQEINVLSQTPNPFFGVQGRSFTDIAGNVTACDPFCPPEVSDVVEVTNAAYARIDYGADFDNGWNLEGNFGVRYVETRVETGGLIGFPNPFFFDDPGASGGNGNGDGIVQVAELDAACGRVPPGQSVPGYCSLSDARKAEFAAGHTGDILLDDRSITFDHWLPSFNARLDVGGGLLFRFAVSKGISRPDLQLFRSGGGIGDNTNDLRADGTLESGPLFQLNTGNRNVRPVESWNYDASVEWYFDDVGSLTVSAFLKDIEGIVNNGFEIVEFIDSNNVAIDVEVNGPVNANGGTLKGVEIGYQQTYDFLPGLLDGLGSALTYTYVDGGEFTNANLDVNQGLFSSLQPLAGISEHTFNATVFYERGPVSARAAYNWRSDFLITPRDDIFPYSPIWQESTGQLDASIFYSVTDYVKVGVQGVNLLDEVTRTSQVIDFDGNRVTRSAFRNDRRFTFLARFEF